MNLKELRRNWDELGKTDPLWAIISTPDKKGNKWQIDEFFEKGKVEIDEIMKYICSLGIELRRKKALDFGCGVGRLTQPLANYFDESYGIDIAPSMVDLANKYNCCGGKCKYLLNDSDGLIIFESNTFNFIYTNITLQHMEPIYTEKYLKEFLRILVSGGLLIFQLPSRPVKGPLINGLQFNSVFLRIEMHYIPKEKVVGLIENNGGKILDIVSDYWAGSDWESFRYCVTKK